MAKQIQPNNASDEIDLGQLIRLIKDGVNSIGNFLLRVFIYLRRNILKLIILALLGIAISYGLNQITSKKFKTEVIVRPNFESKNYLYEVVEEVSANIKSKNESFLNDLKITTDDLKGFKISVAAIEEVEIKTDDAILNDMRYLEVLENFKNENFVVDIIRSELTKKSILDHKITFQYNDIKSGAELVKKIINYINSNGYFLQLKSVNDKNGAFRISKNEELIRQIDQLIANYSIGLTENKRNSDSMVFLENENSLNIASLINIKNRLLKEIETKNLELAKETGVLSILNYGKPQILVKSFFKQTYFLIPALLVVGFLLISFLLYLNRKAKALE